MSELGTDLRDKLQARVPQPAERGERGPLRHAELRRGHPERAHRPGVRAVPAHRLRPHRRPHRAARSAALVPARRGGRAAGPPDARRLRARAAHGEHRARRALRARACASSTSASPFPIGVLTGMLAFMPYIGFGCGLLLATTMAALDWQGPGRLLGVLAVMLGVQVLDGLVVTPRIVGRSVGLAPLEVLLTMMAAGTLFGFFGVLLAVPLGAVVKILVHRVVKAYLDVGLLRTRHHARADLTRASRAKLKRTAMSEVVLVEATGAHAHRHDQPPPGAQRAHARGAHRWRGARSTRRRATRPSAASSSAGPAATSAPAPTCARTSWTTRR